MTEKNQKIKVGDTVLYVSSSNPGDSLLNRMFKVISVNNSSIVGALLNNEGLESLGYNIGYRITFSGNMRVILATREAKLNWYKDQLAVAEDKVTEIKAEIEFLEKYESIEEFVADKIGMLMQADTKEARVAILKTLKQTNFI